MTPVTGLRLDDDYFSTLAADMQRKRDRLGHTLRIHHQDARFGSDWGPLDEHEAPSLP